MNYGSMYSPMWRVYTMTFISGQKGNIAVEYGLIVGLWIAIAASLYIDVGAKMNISLYTLTDAMGITNTQG